MNIRFLVAGAALVAGGVGLMGCSSDSDDGNSSDNDGGSGAEGAAGPGQGGAGPGQGGAGPGQGGAGPGQGGAGPGQGGAGPGQGGAGQGGAGQGGAGQGGGPAGCDDGGTRYADCDACQNAEVMSAGGCCEASYDTCVNDAECVGFATCAGACEDDACVQDCANDFPNGVNLYLDVLDCVFGDQTPQDPGACGLVCVDDPDSCTDGGTEHASCDDCQTTELAAGGCCEAQTTACAGNADCVALNTCLQPCADDACVDACFTANPNGVNDFNALAECAFGDGITLGACGSVCVAASCDDGGGEFATCDDCQMTETDIGGCCEAPGTTCFANVACTDLIDCFAACAPNDMNCANQCQVTYAAGLNDLIALSDCLFGDGTVGAVGSCGVACP